MRLVMFLLCVFGVALFVGAVIYALEVPEDDADGDDSSISGGKNSSSIGNATGAVQIGNAPSDIGKLPNGHRIPSHPESIPKTPVIITRKHIPPRTSPPAARSTAPPPSTTAERILPTPIKPKPSTPITPPKPATPKPAMPKPAMPKPAMPKPATPKPAMPKPAMPKPAMPKPAMPKPATPKPATPKPATPKPATPKPATPKPATPKPTTPKPTTPKPTTPKPTTPKSTTPMPTTPMPTVPKPTTPMLTPPKPTTPMPTIPEPPTPKPSADSTVSRERQRMSGESLICTVSVSGQDRIGIPRDGLCNFLFYDSLYHSQGDTLMKAPGPQLLKFLNAATISRDTDHGCSVDIDNVRAFSDHLLGKRGKKRIKEMAEQNVLDYGFLKLDHSRSSVPSIQEALSALKDVTEIIKEVTGKIGITVLGIYSTLKTSCQTISDIIGQDFKPSAIVILGHISYTDRHAHGCHILPPNLYGVSRDMLKKMGYGHLFEDGVALGKCIEQQIGLTAKIPVKVSLTLKGRRYKAKPEGDPSFVGIGSFDLLRECGRSKRDPKYEQDAPAVRVCGRSEEYKQNINFSEQYQSVVTYDKHRGYTITFDNDDSLRKKVCNARASHGSFSLAAYDVNYDQGKGSCPKWGAKGHYSRLKLVRQLNAYMHGEITGESTDCENAQR